MRANGDVTIWNRYIADGCEKFIATGISGVSICERRAEKNDVRGAAPARENAGEVLIRIPAGAEVFEGRAYVKAEEYCGGGTIDGEGGQACGGQWTLQEGDIVKEGIHEGEVPQSGFYRIVEYADNRDVRCTSRAKHWRVVGG